MERRFELTEEDLIQVQLQVLAAWDAERRRNPYRLALRSALAGVLAWPLFAVLFGHPVFAVPSARTGVAYLLLVGVAGAVGPVLQRRLGEPRKVATWAATRRGRTAARQSVLGPIVLTVDAEGLTRTNAEGTWRIARGEVRDLLHSAWGTTVRVVGHPRVVPIPARAHPDPAAAAELRAALEALQRPPAPAPRHAVRLGLVLAFGFAFLLLLTQRGLAWYHDPRRANAPRHVVLYSTTWCPVCARLRTCLRRDHVPFEERDVEHSARARDEWEVLDGSGVPVTLIGKKAFVGLDPPALHVALARAGFDFSCD